MTASPQERPHHVPPGGHAGAAGQADRRRDADDPYATVYGPGGPEHHGPLPVQWPPYPPAVRRAPAFPLADVLGAISVASLVALVGLPVAWAWSRLAPPQQSIVQADGSFVALPTESQHRFDDLAIFLLIGVAAGVLSGLAVWLLRRRRGPLALVGLAVGSLVAAWLASRLGVSLAEGRADVDGLAEGALAAVPPRLESWWVIVAQPLAAVFTYGVAAAANGADDLGRRLT